MLIVVWTLTVVAGPLIVRFAIDHGLSDGNSKALNGSIVAYVVVAAVAYVVARVQIMAVGRIGEGFLRDLRIRVFNHMQSLSLGFFEREKAGVLVSRMTSDVDSMAELVQFGLLQFISNGLLLAISLALLVVMSWKLTLVCFISVPIVAIASVKFQRDSNKAYLTIRDRIGHNLSSLQEGITGVRVIQAFGREQAVGDRFAESNRSLYDAHMESVRISVWYLPLVEFAGIATTAAVVGIGGWLVHQGEVSLGTVVAFVLLLTNLFEPVQQLSQLFNTVQAAAAGLNKLFGLLDTRSDLPEKRGAVDLPDHGEVRVDNISFSYTGDPSSDDTEWVLRDVALTIAPGERLALVGPTGAGKSTLAKLVARFYDPQRGSITFGGVDLRDAHGSFAARADRRGAAGGVPLQRHDPRQRAHRSSRRHRRRGRRRARLSSVRTSGSACCPRASRPRCANAAAGSPRANASSCHSRGPRSPIPRCSSSTRPPRASTPAPKRWSSGRWTGSSPVAR